MELIFARKYHILCNKNINNKANSNEEIKVFFCHSPHGFSNSPQLIIFLLSYNPKTHHLFIHNEAPKAQQLKHKSQHKSATPISAKQTHNSCIQSNPKKSAIFHNARSRRHLINRDESFCGHLHEFHNQIYERIARPERECCQSDQQIEEATITSFHKSAYLHLHASEFLAWQAFSKKHLKLQRRNTS